MCRDGQNMMEVDAAERKPVGRGDHGMQGQTLPGSRPGKHGRSMGLAPAQNTDAVLLRRLTAPGHQQKPCGCARAADRWRPQYGQGAPPSAPPSWPRPADTSVGCQRHSCVISTWARERPSASQIGGLHRPVVGRHAVNESVAPCNGHYVCSDKDHMHSLPHKVTGTIPRIAEHGAPYFAQSESDASTDCL